MTGRLPALARLRFLGVRARIRQHARCLAGHCTIKRSMTVHGTSSNSDGRLGAIQPATGSTVGITRPQPHRRSVTAALALTAVAGSADAVGDGRSPRPVRTVPAAAPARARPAATAKAVVNPRVKAAGVA
jgi:hypothetical protein